MHHVPSTPDMSPASSTSTEIFPEDVSTVSNSETDKGKSTTSLANKLSSSVPELKCTPSFKFRKFLKEKQDNRESPSSSPIPLPSPDPILIISSDEELEKSMVEFEEKISLEMDTE